MNIFAGNFLTETEFKGTISDIDFDIIEISPKNYFIMWGHEEIQNQSDIQKLLESYFWKISDMDISLDSEWELEILTESTEGESYECVSFEWPNVEFSEILERFSDSWDILCVRETWLSERYGTKIVKIDFLY